MSVAGVPATWLGAAGQPAPACDEDVSVARLLHLQENGSEYVPPEDCSADALFAKLLHEKDNDGDLLLQRKEMPASPQKGLPLQGLNLLHALRNVASLLVISNSHMPSAELTYF